MAALPFPSPFPTTPYNLTSATPYHHPYPSSIPTQIDPNWSLPARPPIHGEPHFTDPPPFPCFWISPYAYPYTAACQAPAYSPSSFGPATTFSTAAQPAPNQEHFRPYWCSPSHPIPLTPIAPNQEHQPPHPPITIPSPGYYSSTFPYDSSCQMREAPQIPTQVDSVQAACVHVVDEVRTFLPKPNNGDDPTSPAITNRMQPDRQPDCVSAGLNDFAMQLKLAQQSLLDINQRLDEYHAQSKRSFASLRSGISKLVDAVPSSKSNTTTARKQSVCFKPSSASIALAESTTPVLSNIDAAEISPASSSFGGCFDVPKPVSVLTVPTAPAAPQVLDEMPEYYSLHNLNRRSLFRAEHSYFTLPVDYPLERAVPEPVFAISDGESNGCSIESVQVFAEEKQHESRQLVKCFGKAQEIEQTAACLNYISDDFDLTLELQQQDDERASNCLVWKASVSFITRSSQLSIEHTMRELRLLWDPGSLKSIMDAPALVKFSSLEGLAHAVIFSPNILLPMSVYAATSILVSLPLYILWDTGDTKYHAMFTTAAGATKFHCVDICKPTMVQKLDVHFRARSESILESAIMSSCAFGLRQTEVNAHQLRDPPLKVLVTPERRKEWDPGEHTFRSSTQNRDIVSVLQTSILTQETTNRPTQCISLKYLLQSAEIKYPCIPSYFFHLRYTNAKCNCWLITVLQSIDEQVKCLNPLSLTTPWDPGVLVILHSCTATHPIVTHPGAFAHVLQSIFASTECYYVFCLGGTEAKTTTVLGLVIPCSKGKSVSMHSLCSCQMVTIAGQTITFQSCATKSVQVTKNKHPREFLMAEMLLIVSEFRDGQLTYMPQSPTINSSEFERHMVTVLSCWLSSLENRAKLQWDPGIAISSYMLNWLKMKAVKTLHWLKRPLLNDEECQSAMSNTPCVWDPGIESLLFPCNRLNITELIQIKRWTSITYSGISLSEYPYTMIFLHDQWEFIHQQGIQENYNPKLLLSSQDCAKVQEMDVIFITFLPP